MLYSAHLFFAYFLHHAVIPDEDIQNEGQIRKEIKQDAVTYSIKTTTTIMNKDY